MIDTTTLLLSTLTFILLVMTSFVATPCVGALRRTSAAAAMRRLTMRKSSFSSSSTSTVRPQQTVHRAPMSTSTLGMRAPTASTTGNLHSWIRPTLMAASVSSVLVLAAHLHSVSNQASVSCQEATPTNANATTTTNASAAASNPLLKRKFGLPVYTQITPENISTGIRHLLSTLGDDLTKLEQKATQSEFTPTWHSLLAPISELSESLSYHYGIVSHLERVRDTEALRAVVKELEPLKVEFGLRVAQSKPLYDAMLKLQSNAQVFSKLDVAQRRIIEQYVLEAKLAGVGLEGEKRKRFNEVKQELESLSTQFRVNVLESTKAFRLVITDVKELEGVPQSALDQFKQAADKDKEIVKKDGQTSYLIGLGGPDFTAIMQRCANRAIREKVYRAYVTRASEPGSKTDNTPIMAKLLLLRHELAGLLDFANYGELSLATKLVASVEQVDTFLEELRVASYDGAVKDLEDLRAFAKEQGCTHELMHWDMSYYSELLREKRYSYSEETLKSYFQYDHVLKGVFDLLNRLYGVTVKETTKPVEVWHKDVKYYEVFDNESKKEIAGIYIDPYSRPEDKSGGAWMDSALQRNFIRNEKGELTKEQIPIAYLICNGAAPVGTASALMSLDEVNTLLHELGHVTQLILTRVDHAMASGIALVQWDAVELPSQYNENWLYDKQTMSKLSKHVETGATLPDDLFEKIKAAKVYRFASDQLRQIHFASTDMGLHTKLLYHDAKQQLAGKIDYTAIGASALAFEQAVAKKTSVVQPLPENRFLTGFSHIFAGGYSAGYYSYKWAEVMAADAWAAVEEAGEDETKIKAVSKKFRDTVLSLGGGHDAAEVYRMFRGRDPTVHALLKQGGLIK